MKKITILFALFIGVMFGCQNSDIELAPAENLIGNEQIVPLRETFDFTYKGVTYSSLYHMENDTLMILEDEEVATLYDQLQELPELATYVTANEEVEYFDTYNELQRIHYPAEKNNNNNKSRMVPTDAVDLVVYEHANYNDRIMGMGYVFPFYVNRSISIPDLDYYGVNESISSFEIISDNNVLFSTYRITFFRNKNYEAQSLSFDYKDGVYDDVRHYTYYVRVPNLKKYKVKKGITWNDRISSFKVFPLN